MNEDLCTVSDAAERLMLHPKTVLRFIRDGRLRATRIGKSYRIATADLEAFAGVPTAPAAATDAPVPTVTSIVDLAGVKPEAARKWSRNVMAALNAKPRSRAPFRADVIHDPVRSHLKIVIVGAPRETANLLALIQIWIEHGPGSGSQRSDQVGHRTTRSRRDG